MGNDGDFVNVSLFHKRAKEIFISIALTEMSPRAEPESVGNNVWN